MNIRLPSYNFLNTVTVMSSIGFSEISYPSSIVTPFMMMEFIILTFSLIVVDAPMVERLTDVLSDI